MSDSEQAVLNGERRPTAIPGWEWRVGLRVWWPSPEGLPASPGGFVSHVGAQGTPDMVVVVVAVGGTLLFRPGEAPEPGAHPLPALRVDTTSDATGGVLLGMLPGVSARYDERRREYTVSRPNDIIRSMATYTRPTLAEACVRMALHIGRWGE